MKPKSSLAERVSSARKHVARMKQVSPYLFPEYQRLQTAQVEMRRAELELARAAAAWEALG